MTDAEYRKLAKERYEATGKIEIDGHAIVSRGFDTGAYVQAWVWVEAADEETTDPGADHDDTIREPLVKKLKELLALTKGCKLGLSAANQRKWQAIFNEVAEMGDPEECDECGNMIPVVDGGGLANRHHQRSCSLYDPNED